MLHTLAPDITDTPQQTTGNILPASAHTVAPAHRLALVPAAGQAPRTRHQAES